MNVHTIREAPIKKGTRVILRADFDVPYRGGKILDDYRILAVVPTIRAILKKGGRIRIISHLGRPHGKAAPSLGMNPIVRYLERALKKKIIFVHEPFIEKNFEKYDKSEEILFFENIRFWPGEEKSDPAFAVKLARWGDIYVNEAFANSHRNHASMVALARKLPSYAGLAFVNELQSLGRVFDSSKRPLVAIIGGIKLETKLPLMKRFLKEADLVLAGSGFSNWIPARRPANLYAPVDYVTSRGKKLDIGPDTIAYFKDVIKKAKTIVWNGPLGLAEEKKFAKGTIAIARSVQKSKGFSIIGGGDTIAILRKYGLLRGFSHISTGGGAMLEFLAGKKLPGIEALKRGR